MGLGFVKSKSRLNPASFYLAERAGFEPAVPFRGTHAFQACQFSHSCISPDKSGFIFTGSKVRKKPIGKAIRSSRQLNFYSGVALFLHDLNPVPEGTSVWLWRLR